MLALGGRPERVRGKLVRHDLSDHPPALAYVDQLTLLRDFEGNMPTVNLLER